MDRLEGLREFTAGDYELLGGLFGAVLPEYPDMGEEFREDDRHIRPPARFKRWIVEREGRAVAMVDYHQHNRLYHPRKYFVELDVHPDCRRRGLGRALYGFVMAELAALDPWIVRVESREDMTDAARMLEAEGYRRVQRYEEWRLDLRALDLEPFRREVAARAPAGLRLASLQELSSIPGHRRLLYELREPLLEDVPNVDTRTPATFEQFEERYFGNPHHAPEGVAIILDGDRWVGLSEMMRTEDPGTLQVGLTAVRREYRGRGVASALKLRVLEWAKAGAYAEAMTWVEEGNNPMLGINKRLGFRPRPAWVTWEKEVGKK